MEPVAFVTQQPRKDSEDRLEGEFLGSQALVGVTFTLMGSLLFATSNVIIKHGLRLAGARGVSAG